MAAEPARRKLLALSNSIAVAVLSAAFLHPAWVVASMATREICSAPGLADKFRQRPGHGGEDADLDLPLTSGTPHSRHARQSVI